MLAYDIRSSTMTNGKNLLTHALE